MAKTVVHDKEGNPIAAEAVDAREMIKSGEYTSTPPDGKPVTLADVETLPGEPQYPPTAQPEHPLPTPHQVMQEEVAKRQEAHKRGEVPKVGFDKDGKPIQPVATGQPFPVPPNAPAFANQSKPAVPVGSPGDSPSNRVDRAPDSAKQADKAPSTERAGVPHSEGGTAKGTVQGGQPTAKHDAK